MKVLHVLNELRPSGAETMLRLAADPWQRDGLELHVMSVGDELGPYAKQLEAAGFRTHHLPLLPAKKFLPAYMRYLRAERFDVVHVHPERANFVFGAMARFIGGAGVVRTVHNVFEFEGRLRLERRTQRALLRAMGVIHVAIGASVREVERERFGNRTAFVRNTYDEGRFQPADAEQRQTAREALAASPDEFLIIVVGNCSHVKNHQVLLEALARAPLPHARLLHVGLENESETRERALAAEMELSDRVDFLGFVHDVIPLMHAANCYVMPSLHEGFPVAALEMLGGGLPSVLTDVPGLRDLKAYVPEALWISPTPDAIAEALVVIAELSSEQREQWSQATAKTIREQFGVERHASAYLRLYRTVAGFEHGPD